MKLHFKIPGTLKKYVNQELSIAKNAFSRKEYSLSWHHLERAHVLGQAWPVEHTITHWQMLIFAFRIKKANEIFGQIPRLLVGGIKSFVGEIPVGNTGGSNVPPLKSMEIPEDLERILVNHKSITKF
jgi:hypothetical protein